MNTELIQYFNEPGDLSKESLEKIHKVAFGIIDEMKVILKKHDLNDRESLEILETGVIAFRKKIIREENLK